MLDESDFTAGDLMTRDVAIVRPDTSLLDAVKLMSQRRVSGMPVVDSSGTIVGLLSDDDLLRWHAGFTDRQAHWLDMLAEGQDLAPEFLSGIQEQNRKVSTVMTPGVVTVTEDIPAREIAKLMYAKHIRRVPVVCDGKLVGIVARSDLVRALAQRLGEMPPERASEHGESVNEALRRGREEAGGTRDG
jgi:CBS domain-containing protein